MLRLDPGSEAAEEALRKQMLSGNLKKNKTHARLLQTCNEALAARRAREKSAAASSAEKYAASGMSCRRRMIGLPERGSRPKSASDSGKMSQSHRSSRIVPSRKRSRMGSSSVFSALRSTWERSILLMSRDSQRSEYA